MKLKFPLMLLTLITLLSFTSCGKTYENGELYIYNWGEYIEEDLIDKFEEEYDIDVIYDTFDSNESMYVKLNGGGVNYDLVIPSDYMIEKMINEDMLEEINYDNIPNYEYISDDLKNMAFDSENKYSVPYFWGTVGILYNKAMVEDSVDSWDILWNENYKNQIFMYDSQRDSLMVALKKLGYSLNSTDEKELEEAKQLLISQKPLVQAYFGDPVRDKMIGEEGALAVVYSGDALYCMSQNENLDYVVPKEGSNIWVDSMVIPKGAENKENAEKFINFMCDPENALLNTEYVEFSTPNVATVDMLPDNISNNHIYWPNVDELANSEVYLSLSPDDSALYDKIWTEVLASN